MKKRIIGKGKWLMLINKNGWEYVTRTNNTRAVVIVAITNNNEIVLVDEFRHALNKRNVSFPAGLLDPGESSIDGAKRELLEETGYAGEYLFETKWLPSNAGLTDESLKIVIFKNVKKISKQNLDETEDITVKVVPMFGDEFNSFLNSDTIGLRFASFLLGALTMEWTTNNSTN